MRQNVLHEKSLRVGCSSDVRLELQFPPLGHPTTRMFNQWTQTIMDLHFLLSPLKDVDPDHSDHHSESEQPKRVCSKAKKHSDKRKHKVRAKYYSQSSSSGEDESSAPIKKSTKPQHKAPLKPDHQVSTDPVFYSEVDMSDLPSQYAEEVETFRQILDLPDPR